MQIDVAITQLKNLISFFEKYRETKFNDAMIEVKKITEALEVEPITREKRIIKMSMKKNLHNQL